MGGGAPRERGRLARMRFRCVPLGFLRFGARRPAARNGMGPAEAGSWRCCRSSRVEELGEALPVLCGRDARAPGGRSTSSLEKDRFREKIPSLTMTAKEAP